MSDSTSKQTEESSFRYAGGAAFSDEEMERVRALIGQPLRIPQWNMEANIDTIRHYALGCGDDNPLWCDEDYGAKTRYGSIVAPPTFLYSTFPAGIGPGFPNLQFFQAGGRWEFQRYVKPGERIVPEARLVDIQTKIGGRAGKMLIFTGEVQYKTKSGELLGRNLARMFRVARKGRDSQSGLKYEPRQNNWSNEELDRIDAEILAYRRQGAKPLYGDDLQIGQALPRRLKGPLDVQTLMTYYAGNLAGGMYRSTDVQVRHRYMALNHPEQIANCRPAEVQAERTAFGQGHIDPKVAAEIGMPGVYDNGWMRVGWCQQVLTDWMGDDGFLLMMDASIHLPNIAGDLLILNGNVVKKEPHPEGWLVGVELQGARHDGEPSIRASASILLPGRTT